ncbi:major facilitator superfamily permease [Amycolatopsis keratiniphila]|uniref:Major facilitator superfamily permease n=1 Tax=Amycolatopsis keratiniphila TaxID=129921 RepID=R4T3X9_9PSEU|nr:major facilitator superfamily permease [Amycolatopsis keratiniphila]
MLLAGGISAFGSQMSMLALPWFVLEQTGSAGRAGLVFAAQILPTALLGLLGGEVVQRFGPRRVMVCCDAARAPVIALVPVLHAAQMLSFGLLLGIVVVLGVFTIPYLTAQRLLGTELTHGDAVAVTRVNSVLEGTVNLAAFAGPAVAGLLLTALSPGQVLLADAGTYAVSALLLSAVPAVGSGRGTAEAPRGLLAGLGYLRGDRFLGMAAVSSVLYGLLFRMLWIALPLLAFQRFDGDPAVGGLLVACSGAGAVLGSITAYLVASRFPPRLLAAGAAIVIALPLWVLVTGAALPWLLAALAVSAAAVPVLNAPYFTLLTTRVPPVWRPKVLQAVITVNALGGPAGFLLAGFLIDRAGLDPVLYLVALVATFASAVFVTAAWRAGPAPDTGKAVPMNENAPAVERTRTETAAIILKLYRAALDNDALTADSDFFESDGDSMAAFELTVGVLRELGVELPVGAVFTHPSPDMLTDAVLAVAAGRA